ncbi:polysaccharide biosynthesis/export family protein [Foetidibacter luteolus]|uniref:polysaccharide biosynthesis/export family protein n=1 Tax=Foetidibacter luteolus TaxID=2608880 RepID=UPI001A99A31B|nr:polysaccharide biosynthesis/export family protein [Foetidibacter luteolus]
MNKPTACAYLLILPFLFITACVDIKKATYFNNLPDTSRLALNEIKIPQQTIQVNDQIEVRVGGENEKATEYINQYLTGGAGSTGGIQNMVDIDGNIELPLAGKIHIAGLTRDEARDAITKGYAVYLKNPIVSLKFLNFKFTVLGEVKSPGYFNSTNEKINLFEAIAMAGDMTPYSRRDRVKIIRDDNGKREIITLDFNDKNILNSPDYYINRADIIYVEAQKNRFVSENFSKTISVLGAVTGIIALFLAIFRN